MTDESTDSTPSDWARVGYDRVGKDEIASWLVGWLVTGTTLLSSGGSLHDG